MARPRRGKSRKEAGAGSAAADTESSVAVDVPEGPDVPTDEAASQVGGTGDGGTGTEPGVEQPFSSPMGGEPYEGLLEEVLSSEDVMSAPVDPDDGPSVAIRPPEDPEDRYRAIAIGLLLGAAVGLVIDAILSNLLFAV